MTNHKTSTLINNEHRVSIDEATPEDWDKLHQDMAEDPNSGSISPKLGPYAEYRLHGGCQICEE